MILPPLLLATLIASSCFTTFAFAATLLPNDEVDALEEIAHTLGKTDWNFTADPCSQQWGWATQNSSRGFENNVTCDCSFSNNTVCHVVSIVLKSQNLSGVLPELGKLPYLKEMY
ncbi:hypothetical protein L1049_000833 [Liquidambar formosana]|uniref:Uncharacterized protein n=1 Tax=Liquidambar formosana TaxID=63359 RepID=A0AAP0N9R5_LIQFO